MKHVPRSDIVDYVTYEEQRDEFRSKVLAIKRPRRIHVGEHLTFLFENSTTIRYQVQEMMRTERIVKEADIVHELHTYNELLGGPGELGCTLLIEIDDEEERSVKLKQWIELIHHLYFEVESGDRIRPKFDERQIGRGRLSSVQYLKFDLQGQKPTAIGADFSHLTVHTELNPEQVAALSEDLGI